MLAFETHGSSYSSPYKLILACPWAVKFPWSVVLLFSYSCSCVLLFAILCILVLFIICTVMYNSKDDIQFGIKCLTQLLFTLQVHSWVGHFLTEDIFLHVKEPLALYCQKTVNMVMGITVAFLMPKVL